MLLRYRARNWPESLNEEEQEEWQHYRQQRLSSNENEKILSHAQFAEILKTCRERDLTDEQKTVLTQIEHYASDIA